MSSFYTSLSLFMSRNEVWCNAEIEEVEVKIVRQICSLNIELQFRLLENWDIILAWKCFDYASQTRIVESFIFRH